MKKLIPIGAVVTAVIVILALFARYELRQERLRKAEEARLKKAPEVTVTIIEGWTASDIANYLEKQNITKAADFLAAEKNFDASPYAILAAKPAGASLEGFLFPDTYKIYKPQNLQDAKTSAAVIKKLLDNFSSKISPQMREDLKTNKYSLYQIVTLASIIEKETGNNLAVRTDRTRLLEERKMVAGIFYNRLRAGQSLQSDATVNYINGKNLPQVLIQDTQIDSPYNTYKFAGLPPGPICNPSLSSITAAMYPTANDYFYFLHKQPDGEIVYSKTYEEHVKNKQKYLK